MNLILAESVEGGIRALLVLLCGLGAALLAWGALAPAILRKRVLTLVLVSPALIAVVAITVWIGSGFFTGGQRFPQGPLADYFGPWLFFAGPPLGTSCVVLVVLWFRTRRRPPSKSL